MIDELKMTRNLSKAIQRDAILYVQQHRPLNILPLNILFRFFTLNFFIFVFYDIAPLFATQIPLMHNIEWCRALEGEKLKKKEQQGANIKINYRPKNMEKMRKFLSRLK